MLYIFTFYEIRMLLGLITDAFIIIFSLNSLHLKLLNYIIHHTSVSPLVLLFWDIFFMFFIFMTSWEGNLDFNWCVFYYEKKDIASWQKGALEDSLDISDDTLYMIWASCTLKPACLAKTYIVMKLIYSGTWPKLTFDQNSELFLARLLVTSIWLPRMNSTIRIYSRCHSNKNFIILNLLKLWINRLWYRKIGMFIIKYLIESTVAAFLDIQFQLCMYKHIYPACLIINLYLQNYRFS